MKKAYLHLARPRAFVRLKGPTCIPLIDIRSASPDCAFTFNLLPSKQLSTRPFKLVVSNKSRAARRWRRRSLFPLAWWSSSSGPRLRSSRHPLSHLHPLNDAHCWQCLSADRAVDAPINVTLGLHCVVKRHLAILSRLLSSSKY